MNKNDRALLRAVSLLFLLANLSTIGVVALRGRVNADTSPVSISFADYLAGGTAAEWLSLKGVYLDLDHAVVIHEVNRPIQVYVPAYANAERRDNVKLLVDASQNYREQAQTGLLPYSFFANIEGILRPPMFADFPDPSAYGQTWKYAADPRVLILNQKPNNAAYVVCVIAAPVLWVALIHTVVEARRRARRELAPLGDL